MMPGPKRRPPIDRFMANVSPEPNTGCWLWLGYATSRGYARFNLGGHQGRHVPAYRFSYEAFVGPIPAGMLACHKCDVPQCVNPDHIFIGTQTDNMRDCAIKGRTAKGPRKKNCKCGRAFDRQATPTVKQQICSHCRRERVKRHYRRNRDVICAKVREKYRLQRS
jgi:hypothetical protein